MKTLKLTKDEIKKLQSQYVKGGDLATQDVVVKIFNPYGRGRWYLINQDPNDPDYLWAIVDLGYGAEVGSVSLSDLENLRVKVFGGRFPLEKDRGFNRKNALEVYNGLREGKFFKDGGEVEIKVLDDVYNKSRYKGIYEDSDKDGVPDIDDKSPKNPKVTETVETVKFQEVFDSILKTKNEMKVKMKKVVEKLVAIAPKDATIYARTKSPFSILNKLVNKKMYNMKPTMDGDVEGLTDLVGTSVVVNSLADINKMRDKLDDGYLGSIMERKDYYEKPKDGYMAIHYIVNFQDTPVEVQLKTKRQKALNESSHNPYKFKNLDSAKLLQLTKLADQADRGDKTAQRSFDLLIKDPKELEYSLYADKKRLNRLPS